MKLNDKGFKFRITPSGRFQTNTRLCLSISDYHKDTWNPSWTVSTILTGLISFMNDTTSTLGSINTSMKEKQRYARLSREYNLKDPVFCSVFEELAETLRQEVMEERRVQGLAGSSTENTQREDSSSYARCFETNFL